MVVGISLLFHTDDNDCIADLPIASFFLIFNVLSAVAITGEN